MLSSGAYILLLLLTGVAAVFSIFRFYNADIKIKYGFLGILLCVSTLNFYSNLELLKIVFVLMGGFLFKDIIVFLFADGKSNLSTLSKSKSRKLLHTSLILFSPDFATKCDVYRNSQIAR